MGQFLHALNSAASFLTGMVDDVGRRTGLAQPRSDVAPRGPTDDADDRAIESGPRELASSTSFSGDGYAPEPISDEELEFLDDDPVIDAEPMPDFDDDGLFEDDVESSLGGSRDRTEHFVDTEAATEPSLRSTRE